MKNIDERTKELFADVPKESAPKFFADFVMERIKNETAYSPLISLKVLFGIILVFFVPPILMMFSMNTTESNVLSPIVEINRQFINFISYKNLELYMVLGISLFWLYFILEQSFTKIITH